MVALGIVIATVAAFILSAVLYGVTSQEAPPSAPTRPPLALASVELARNAAVAGLVGGLLVAADWSGPADGMLLGLGLGVVPIVLLAGSVFHEGVPARRATLHAVDWIMKLIVIGLITALFT